MASARFGSGLADPAYGAFAITAGAGALARPTRGIYIGGAGDVTVTMADGASVTFNEVPAGTILPVRATHVTAAAATELIGLY